MNISNIEKALILVGKNSSGKSNIMKVIRALGGDYSFSAEDFNEKKQNIEIAVSLQLDPEDLMLFHKNRILSRHGSYQAWEKVFRSKLPSFQDGLLTFLYIANREGSVRYDDGVYKNNKYIKEIFPKIYFLDTQRDLLQLQEEILLFQENEILKMMRSGCCLFNRARNCTHCFQCIGLLHQKTPAELDAFETAKLLEYKLYSLNLDDFSKRVNRNIQKNGGFAGEIRYVAECDTNRMFQVRVEIVDEKGSGSFSVSALGKGMRSIYLLSLLEAYVEEQNQIPSLILLEAPETFQHPGMQRITSEILFRLSKKNQVIFTTYSPNLLYNFNSRQIRQVVLEAGFHSNVKEHTNIDVILDELGYSANDLLNVNFVFIVEGKQDKGRLPLLLEKYYGEIQNEDGHLSRIAIITTNSCTNIKTYANLKYMNKIYLKDQFLMIRDGDGKEHQELVSQLCRYYEKRGQEDVDTLPRVSEKNVLVLKYYSFENYFLNPQIMVQIGVIDKPEDFYQILLEKWKEYLYRLKSGQKLVSVIGRDLEDVTDVKMHMEAIKTYLRGHNLFDLFYGAFRKQEKELLTKYIDCAPRNEFQDILDGIERFAFFESRRY
jgi:hypothetical protein